MIPSFGAYYIVSVNLESEPRASCRHSSVPVHTQCQVNQRSSELPLIIILIECEDIAQHAWYGMAYYYYSSATEKVGRVGSCSVLSSVSVVNVLINDRFICRFILLKVVDNVTFSDLNVNIALRRNKLRNSQSKQTGDISISRN